jgi:tetratricopeptide (TPR) repeat protein
MARQERVLVASLGFGLVLVLLVGLRGSAPAETSGALAPAPQATAPLAGTVDADIGQFLKLLDALRHGDDGVVPAMRELAERLCTVHARCEGRDILAFYAGMPAEDRARGLEEQARFQEIVTRVRRRFGEGRLDEEWTALRDTAVVELAALAERSLSARDVFPGACAAGFRARLEADRLLSDYRLEPDERADLLDAARTDVAASLEALGRCGMVSPRLEPMWVSGYLHASAGETIEAGRAFQECLDLARRLRRPEWQEYALEGLVDIAREAGDSREIALLLGEMSRFRTPSECWYLVREQATLLLQQDFAESASRFLLDHPPIDPLQRREWNILLGSAFLREGKLDLAREQYALAEPMRFSRDIALGMASVDLQSGNAERVLEQLAKPEFQGGLYPFEETLALQLSGEAAVDLGRYGEAAEKLDRALRIGGDIQERLALERDLVGAATSVVGERVGLHALALLARARLELGQHVEAARAIESWQSRTLRGTGAADLSTDDLMAWARSASLGLVTWVVGPDSSVVAHVAPDGSAQAVAIRRGRRSIEAAARRLTEAALGTDPVLAERLAAQVRAELLPDAIRLRIESSAGSGPQRLLVLVHGPVERMPIELLLRDERVIPVVLPGLPSREPGAPLDPGALARWSIIGSPVDAAGVPALPGAREELAEIAKLRGEGRGVSSAAQDADATVQAAPSLEPQSLVRVGSAFDRDSLVAALRDTRPLHVATHLVQGCGSAGGRLADVGLELSGDSSLCASEIAAIRPRLPLAVLAACATGEGRFVDAEGLQGVSRAFLESGTRNVLVTLWPVDDASARRFAVEFHRALIAGDRPSEAAAQARAALRESGLGPADWAAFRLIGRD